MNPKKRVAIEVGIGLGLSVGLSIFFLINSETGAALATMAGLLGGVITLQVESILQDNRRAEYESKMGAVLRRLEGVPWLADAIDKMSASAVRVEENFGRTPVGGISAEVFSKGSERLARLESGSFQYPWSDYKVVMRVLRDSQSTMWVTSVPDADLRWWRTPQGEKYWQLQREVMARDVRIRRIFIYSEWTEELDTLARKQKAAGVAVRKVHRDQLSPDLVVTIGIWDDTCGHDTAYDSDGKPAFFNFTVTDAGMEHLRQRFYQVEEKSVEIDTKEPPR